MSSPEGFDFCGKVYIQGPDHGNLYLKMFEDMGFIPARLLQEADIVCFTGGEDVDPQLYGQVAIPETNYNKDRDSDDIDVWSMVEDNPVVLKIGICRGAQFLNVMNGGSLWQDVNHHATREGHKILDVTYNKIWHVSSTHHQMMRPSKSGRILAYAAQATRKKCAERDICGPKGDTGVDPEVVFYEDTHTLCFQPHPEYPNFTECRDYFCQLLFEFY